jgi:16S rRNA G966 N2-methylase RsmD
LWLKTLQTLDEQPGWLAPGGWVIVQIDPVEYETTVFKSFVEFEQRRYGSTLLIFFDGGEPPTNELPGEAQP